MILHAVQQLETYGNAGVHVADAMNELMYGGDFPEKEILPIIHELLIKKWSYKARSWNVSVNEIDAKKIYEQVVKWKACDIVIVNHHPDLGLIVLNPKNPQHQEGLESLKKNELIVVYSGYQGKKESDALCETAVSKTIDALLGKKVTVPDPLLKGSFIYRKPKPELLEKHIEKTASKKAGTGTRAKTAKSAAKAPTRGERVIIGGGPASGSEFSFAQRNTASAGLNTQPIQAKSTSKRTSSITGNAYSGDKNAAKRAQAQTSQPASFRKVTPLVSVPVTNELFHNGNVEAWKRIIASYENKYPNLHIFVYYEGERITDINSLFKWGKVKHGSSIQFVVAGDDIQDVAKLKRYFTQGASPQFEAFLQGAPGTILPLF